MNILPEEIEKKVTARTKAILPVHFAGRCCDMDPILEIVGKYDLLVIEDCAHAIEAEYHDRQAGRFGDIGCFSFYVTENVITGEGGMVVTDDDLQHDPADMPQLVSQLVGSGADVCFAKFVTKKQKL
jgi:dTDP-4-amino-4,6-dideoxygalactose transaminase